MKKSLLFLSLVLFGGNTLNAQCNNGRYASNVFPTVTVTSDIQYGSNTSFSGTTTNLTMDIYEPTGDTATVRPLIIWTHGGSFIGGTKADADMVAFSNDFAQKGYVCVSINYRLGFFPIDSANAVKAVIRAVQDLKATVRYFKKDFATTNTYNIDTNNIFIGGSSAGAITALHAAYLKNECEIIPYVGQTTLNNLGGLTGNSGSPGYSSSVKGVINLCGALAKYHWLEAGDVPFVSLHGTADAVVKYNRGQANPGVPLLYLDGSRMLYERAVQIGVENPFYTFAGADHVPHSGSAAYEDTTINVIRDFLIDQLGCTDPQLQPVNSPLQTANMYPFTACTATINESKDLSFELYPNPNNGTMQIQLPENTSEFIYTITSINGKIIQSETISNNQLKLNLNLVNGIYLIHIQTSTGETGLARICIQN